MPKKRKDNWLGARVDDAFVATVKEYVALADVDQAGLFRNGVLEYMTNHPVKRPRAAITKPGE